MPPNSARRTGGRHRLLAASAKCVLLRRSVLAKASHYLRVSAPISSAGSARISVEFRTHQASTAVMELGARGLAAGRDVALAPGQWQPGTPGFDRLLGHELAHVLDQGISGPAVQLDTPQAASGAAPQGAATIVPPFTERVADVWPEFERESMFRTARARDLALRVLRAMTDPDDQVRYGVQLANWFFDNGMEAEGLRALTATRDAWMLRHVTIDPARGVPQPQGLGGLTGGPEQLIDRAEAAARAGNNTLAFTLFGTAFQLISWQLDEAGPRREAQLAGSPAQRHAADMTRTLFYYPSLHDAYRQLRRILGFYRVLEAERQAAGDAAGARYASGLSLLLYMEIRDRWIWDSDSGVLTEVEDVVDPRRGDALRIHGENSQSIDVTQLPGLPAPREVTRGSGGFTFQHQTMGAIAQALFGQTELMAELSEVPEIRRAFGTTPIDMNDLGQRLRVWRIMYGVYQARGS